MLLKAVAITQMPLVYFTFINNRSEIQGNLLDFPRILQKYANLSYQITSPKAPGWNGMMKDLANNEADISLTPIVQTASAMNLVTFSKTIYFSSYVILSKLNQFKTKTDLIDHVYKIDLIVWVLLLLSIAILFLVIYFDRHNDNECVKWWYVICIIFIQSYSFKFKLKPATILITIFGICYSLLLILTNTLIGVRIVVVDNNEEINSLDDIIRTGNILPSIYKSTSLETLLSTSNNPVHQQLWSLVKSREDLCLRVPPSIVNGESVGHDQNFYQALLQGKVVTFEPDYYSDLIIYDYCRYVPVMRWHRSPPVESLPLRFSFGIRKGLDQHFIKMIDKFIERLKTAGLFDKWFLDDNELEKIFDGNRPPPECAKSFGDSGSEYIPINYSNMKYFSRVLSVMFTISYMMLWFEIFRYDHAIRLAKITSRL